jgi:hypothetical protein
MCAVLLLGSPRPGHATAASSGVASDAAPDKTPDPSSGDDRVLREPPTPRKDHFVPIFDIAAFEALVNRYGFYFVDRGTYDVSARSVRRNLHSPWVLDSDPFATNQFLHPAQGAMYHDFARSAGLNYWESLGYTFAGSALWEIAGETTLPSRNDQITTGIGGTFLGEPLFRLANLVLEQGTGLPPFWRELAAAILSPATGFNRVAYGGRFKTVFPSRSPSFFMRLQLGATGTATARKGLGQRLENEAAANFSIDYGLPGNAGYEYHRPFDYFNIELTASSANDFESIFSRGLLAGRTYGAGAAPYRGVWGLYGMYDYVAPQLFRVSSTAFALGTTLERRFSGASALQSTLLAGIGYGAAGTIHGTGTRDYHFGLTPQALVAERYIAGDRVALDVTVRDYHVSGIASAEHRGAESIARADAQVTVRVLKHQAGSIRYTWSHRSAAYPDLGDVVQSRGSVGLFYTFLGGMHFGAVAW